MMREVADYYRQHGVRVVNMSWGGSLRGIEAALEDAIELGRTALGIRMREHLEGKATADGLRSAMLVE